MMRFFRLYPIMRPFSVANGGTARPKLDGPGKSCSLKTSGQLVTQ